MAVRTYVYVDGFNLYYGAVKGTQFKWLDISKVCHHLLPNHKIQKIKYFTALVTGRANDPDAPNRQQIYLRALRTFPNIDIIYGHFLTHKVFLPRADSPTGNPQFVEVLRTEEKGSDVNLAAHLLSDAYKGEFDIAVLVTNDSDLQEPVRIVSQELQLPIGVINPQRPAVVVRQGKPRKIQSTSRELTCYAKFVKVIRKGLLAASQLPPVLNDQHGSFTKPSSW